MTNQAKCNEPKTAIRHKTQDSQTERLREEIINSRERAERANEERKERSLKELARATG
jgi:hypothetical protein